MSDMGFTVHQHKKAILRRIRYKIYVQYAESSKRMHSNQNEESPVRSKIRRSTAILILITLSEISTSELSIYI